MTGWTTLHPHQRNRSWPERDISIGTAKRLVDRLPAPLNLYVRTYDSLCTR